MKFELPPNTPKGQKEAITANEKFITVSAGAGSGKTWVLSNRYVRLLFDDKKLMPENILTLTFTEAAAGEMQERIESRIRQELEHVSKEDSSRRQEIIDGLSNLWISTIHAFAAKLIRESGLSLDIDPRATVISTHQTQDFWEEIKNALEFSNLRELARAYGDKELFEIAKKLDQDDYLSACVNKWKSGQLTRLAMETSELHASAGREWKNMLAWSENDVLIETAKKTVKDLLRDEWLEVWNLWQEINLPPSKKSEGSGANLNVLLSWLKDHRDSYSDEELQYFYEALVIDKAKNIVGHGGEPFKTLTQKLGMTLGEWRKERPLLVRKITRNFKQDLSSEEIEIRKVLMKFCALCWGMWDKMKTRRGLLSFSDMIFYAKSALDKGGIDRGFSHILIDEFQDTDFVQDNMINSFMQSGENLTSLFCVGDYQQSIYKFRHAEPKLFVEKIKNADKEVKLDVSFRTRDSLLRRINKIFSSLWSEGLGKMDSMRGLSFNSLNAAFQNNERDSGTIPDFKIILASHNQRSTKNAKRDLAENLAFNIYTWVKEGKTIWDKKEKIIRPVKYSDFAILTRSRWIYPVIEDALGKFNIKTIEDRSNDFFNRGEVNDVVCLLRAAADINDSFAVAGWLMSPFSGLEESEAIKILQQVNKSQSVTEILSQKYPDLYSRLEYFSLIGEHEGGAALLSLFDKNRKWLACYKESDRLRVLRNLRRAISIARSYQEYGTSTLNACAEYLTRAIKNKVSEEEPGWNDENSDAVKLGAVHSAKGLEYPVTVIFEQRIKQYSDYGTLKPSKELGITFADLPEEIKDPKIELYCSNWDRLLSEQGDIEEEKRLFYVAATRAQDSLIFCGLVNEKDDKPHKNTWTEFLLENCDDVEPVYIDELDYDYLPVIAPETDERILTPVDLVHEKISLRQFSATSFALFEWCPFAWRRKYKQGLNLSWDLDIDINDDDYEPGGADLGSLTHWILARWPKNNLDYESELEHLLYNRESFNQLPGSLRRVWREGNKAAVKKWLMNFAESELGKKLMREKNLKREYKFMLHTENKTTLAGSIDALYENNVIDYKITAIDNAPRELYESQIEFYAYVIHELFTTADSVKACTVFLREGEIFEKVYSDFDSIKTRIITASEKCASQIYEANINHCAACPFKKGCVKNAERN